MQTRTSLLCGTSGNKRQLRLWPRTFNVSAKKNEARHTALWASPAFPFRKIAQVFEEVYTEAQHQISPFKHINTTAEMLLFNV